MRKTRNALDTQQRVLSAAQALFAAKGFAGTSLAEISQACGISDGLILHHFHTKRNLYHQVLENLAEQYTQVLAQARQSAATPQESMQRTLTAAFRFWQQDQAYQRISMWAYLEGQPELAANEAHLTAGLSQAVQDLQARGLLDPGYSPAVLLTMIIGPIHFWLRYRDQFQVALGLTGSANDLDDLFLSQLVQLITRFSQKADSTPGG